MNIVTTVTKNSRVLAFVLAAAFGWSATTSNAADAEEAYDNIIVTQRVSANSAKRLGRRFLVERGFSYGVGIGAARIKSITRDGDTWILHVRYSQDSLTMRHSALLYVDAKKALVSDVAPKREPQQVAAK